MTYTVRVNLSAGTNNEFVVNAESASVSADGVLAFWANRGLNPSLVAAFAGGQWLAFSEQDGAEAQ